MPSASIFLSPESSCIQSNSIFKDASSAHQLICFDPPVDLHQPSTQLIQPPSSIRNVPDPSRIALLQRTQPPATSHQRSNDPVSRLIALTRLVQPNRFSVSIGQEPTLFLFLRDLVRESDLLNLLVFSFFVRLVNFIIWNSFCSASRIHRSARVEMRF